MGQLFKWLSILVSAITRQGEGRQLPVQGIDPPEITYFPFKLVSILRHFHAKSKAVHVICLIMFFVEE